MPEKNEKQLESVESVGLVERIEKLLGEKMSFEFGVEGRRSYDHDSAIG